MGMRKRHYLILSLGLFFVCLLFGVGLMKYYTNLQAYLWEQNLETLQEIEAQQIYNFDLKLTQDIQTMESLATITSTYYDYEKNDVEETVSFLNDIMKKTDFDLMCYANLNGELITDESEIVSIEDRKYFELALQGKSNISNPLRARAKVEDEDVIIISAPVFARENASRVVGVLVGYYKAEVLNGLLLPSYNEESYVLVTTNTGEIVAQSENTPTEFGKNLFDYYGANVEFSEVNSLENIKKILYANKGGDAVYETDGQESVVLYDTMDTNDWKIFSITPKNTINRISNNIIRLSLVLCLNVAVLFFAIAVAVFWGEVKNKKRLEQIAYFDDFTKAPTEAKFRVDAQRYVDEFFDEKKFIMVKFDVENFKLMNQILGEKTGDRMIQSLSDSLKENTKGKYYRFARVRDDEFLVLHEYEKPEDIFIIREKYIASVLEKMGDCFSYDFKIVSGYYFMSEDYCQNVVKAIEKANMAHRYSKKTGAPLTVYNQEFVIKAIKDKEIENEMETALIKEEFQVFLQPKIQLSDYKIIGAEALVRWFSHGKLRRYPNEFIPIFEEDGFIVKLDYYMFEKVCAILERWKKEGHPLVPISVNFSRLHLSNPNFPEDLCAIADRYDIPHSLLELELLENSMMDHIDTLEQTLFCLKKYEFNVSMDDFGTGYSSLGLLKEINIDSLKIDRSFFSAVADDERAKYVLRNILALAQDLNIATVAEGVEEADHIEILRELGCDIVQGFYFEKPIPVSDFEKILKKKYSEKKPLHSPIYREGILSGDRKSGAVYKKMLDNTETIFVVVEKQTHRILYMNQAAKAFSQNKGELGVNAVCYEHVYGLQEACSFCMLNKEGEEGHTTFDHMGRNYDVLFMKIDWEGKKACLTMIRDNTETLRYIKNIEKRAQTDSLTQIYNRGAAERFIKERINKGNGFVFAMIDLDNLKSINDQFGHVIGDQAIKSVSQTINLFFQRKDDVVARFGGDEFVVFTTSIQDETVLEEQFEQLLTQIRQTPVADGAQLSCSIGAVIGGKESSFDVLYKNADLALYEAKSSGKNNLRIYKQ